MPVPCQMPANVLTGKDARIDIGCPGNLVELPFMTAEFNGSAEKNDTTGSTSRDAEGNIWKESSPGARSMTLTVKGQWRPGAAVIPPYITEGAYYYIDAWYRRPGATGVGDAGYGRHGVWFTESNNISVNTSTGMVEYTVTFSSSGPITLS